jgi:hypothetical protein
MLHAISKEESLVMNRKYRAAKLNKVRSLVKGVIGEVFDEFMTLYGNHSTHPDFGEVCRVDFEHESLPLGKYDGQIFYGYIYVSDDGMAVSEIQGDAPSIKLDWINLGDPELCEKVQYQLGKVLVYG